MSDYFSVRGVDVHYDKVNALAGASMTLAQGDIVAVIGANGAGKSTLLASLAGLLAPDSGTILIGGRAFSAFSRVELARLRAYLPQSPRCEWPISVERLIALGLRLLVVDDPPETVEDLLADDARNQAGGDRDGDEEELGHPRLYTRREAGDAQGLR